MTKIHLILSFLLLLFSLTTPTSSSSYPFIYGGCSQIKYIPNSPYESNLNSLMASILNSATLSPYNKYTISAPSPSPTIYGVYQCRGDMPTSDCASCIHSAVSQIATLCLGASAGTLQLDGCFVKYDNVSFLGVQDKTLVLKKCGPPTGRYDTDMLNRRDEVLSSLGGGTGLYRQGSVGYVSGVAQCVGDLDVGQCTDCVSDAVERLRGGCGWSVSGDVFLGKCFARYVAGPAYTTGAVYSPNVGSDVRSFGAWWWRVLLVSGLINLLKCP